MPRKYVEYKDLTQRGLVKDIPTTEQVWTQLDDTMVEKGMMVKRPGLKKIGTALPAGIQVGNPLAFAIHKWVQSFPKGQVLRPNTTVSNSGWTVTGAATAHQAVDEAVANGLTDYVSATAANSEIVFGFDNLTGTWNNITSLQTNLMVYQDTEYYQAFTVSAAGLAGTYTTIGTVTLYPGTQGWINQPLTLTGYNSQDIDALRVKLTKGTSYKDLSTSFTPTGINGSTGAVWFGLGTMMDKLSTNDGDTSKVRFPAYSASGIGVEFADIPTGKTNYKIKVVAKVQQAGIYPDGAVLGYSIYERRTDGGYGGLIGGTNAGFYLANTWETCVNTPFTPPSTNGIIVTLSQYGGPSSPNWLDVTQVVVTYTDMTYSTVLPLQVTQVSIPVSGDGDSTTRFALLMPTDRGFLSCSEDLTTYTDVHGSVAAPTSAPDLQVDHAMFLDKIYFANGRDYLYYFPNGTSMGQLTSGPTGSTTATFAKRLFLGDVYEGGVRSPSRIRWSKVGDATNWTDATSGNLNLDETPGKVVKIKPIVERSADLIGTLAVYKQFGIYHISATTDPNVPFMHKLMDSATGCVAKGTVKGFVDNEGRENHVFLGRIGNTINVVSWNGAVAVPLGNDIASILNDLADTINLDKSIAEIDANGNYILLFPLAGQRGLSTALVYNFSKKFWTLWNIGDTTAIGMWQPNTKGPVTVIGRSDDFAYEFDGTQAHDDQTYGESAIEQVICTGDIQLPVKNPIYFDKKTTLHRLWIWYIDEAAAQVDIDVSHDGGITWEAGTDSSMRNLTLGGLDDGSLKLVQVDLNTTGYVHRVRLKCTQADQKIRLVKMGFEYEVMGI